MGIAEEPLDIEFRHCAIFVHDVEKMKDFYTRVLGFPISDHGELDYGDEDGRGIAELVFMSRDPDEHHQIILVGGRPKELSFNPINHIAFRVKTLDEVRQAFRKISTEKDVTQIRPVTHGNAWSLYFLDPEGNRLEIYTPSPWYIPQPYRVALDLELSDDELVARTRKLIENEPGFISAEERFEKMKKIIATA